MPSSSQCPTAGFFPAGPPLDRRVLIVEDSADIRETLQLLLRLWGYQVEVAGDGRVGVEKALDWKPHVAIVDIGLPVLNGFEVAEQVRAAFRDGIFLIALTGYSQPEVRTRAFQAGFDVHLTKPADLDELSRLLAAER